MAKGHGTVPHTRENKTKQKKPFLELVRCAWSLFSMAPTTIVEWFLQDGGTTGWNNFAHETLVGPALRSPFGWVVPSTEWGWWIDPLRKPLTLPGTLIKLSRQRFLSISSVGAARPRYLFLDPQPGTAATER